MKINSILIKNFRKFDNKEFLLNDKMAFTGKNSIGKTSILESIFFLLTGKSFRINTIKELINNKKDYFF